MNRIRGRAAAGQSNRQPQKTSRRTTGSTTPSATSLKTITGSDGAEADALEMSLFTTILLALFVIGVGAGLAVVYFKIYYPECLQGVVSASNVPRQLRRVAQALDLSE
jgi:hypothetical protein